MATRQTSRSSSKKFNTGSIWTNTDRRVIKSLTQRSANPGVTLKRLKGLCSTFATKATKLKKLIAKSANGRKRH